MITGKKMGLKKGDLVWTGYFPGVIISDVQTFAPCCEVWGLEHECGSAHASEMKKLSKEEFLQLLKDHGYTPPLEVWSDASVEGLKAVGIEASKR